MTGLGDEDYETITASGQTVRIGANQTYQNKLIDLTNGGSITLLITGGGATVRNIGFKGMYRGSGFIISITAGGDTVTVENVYIGDGANKEGESFVHGPGAVFYHRDASAPVDFRYCNVQGYPNNGFYCSNSASGGRILWENCFGKNNGVTTFRGANGGDTIRNCVAYNDNTDYGPGYGGYSETNGRPVWAWSPGPIDIYNSHFAAGPYPRAIITHDGSSVNMHSGGLSGGTQGNVNVDSSVGSPDLSVPEGVPTSAEQAATGGGGGSSGGGAPSNPSPPPSDDSDDEDPPEEEDSYEWQNPGNVRDGPQPTPPQDPDRSAGMTGAAFTRGSAEVRDCDLTWLGDGRVMHASGGASVDVYNTRFRGDDPDENGITIVDPDTSNPSEDLPPGAPNSGPDAIDDASGYPTTISYLVSDCYLSDIEGPALHLGARSLAAEIRVENVHIDGADYGIIADGVPVIVRDCEIVADVPFGSVNGGSIDYARTNYGDSADPRAPSNVPDTPETAARSDTQL